MIVRNSMRRLKSTFAAVIVLGGMTAAADAVTLKEAIAIATQSNPEIGQAIENREAIEFELRQARGLYLPTIDLEASAGVRRLDTPNRRLDGVSDDSLSGVEAGVVVTQKLFDFGARRAEVDRQAARVDGASLRVLERSEYVALAVVQDYLEALLQSAILRAAQDNEGFHQSILGDIRESVDGGVLTDADRQQGEERLFAARTRTLEAKEEFEAARIRFFKTLGVPLTGASRPSSVASALPATLDEALRLARTNNPRVRATIADVDAAHAMVDSARAAMGPEVLAEGRGRIGHDVDGQDGRTADLQARLVMRWNLYRGGIDTAREQEQIRRASEQRLVLHQVHRDLEETVRLSWDRRFRQAELAGALRKQATASDRLVASYREQFQVGQRSLLDVLSAQNARFNAAVLADSASYASLFAEYRLLAATGRLLSTMGVTPAGQSEAYARNEFDVPPTPATETFARVPSRQTGDLPFDLLAPIRKE